MRINTQVPAIGTLRELQKSFLDVQRLNERLSSGSKINRASDAPAALVLSERFRAQLAEFSQAGESLARTGSVLNTADGAFAQAGDLLVRGRALAVEAANAQSPEELQALQGEANGILDGLRRIGASTSFGGQKLTDGSQAFTVQNADPAFSDIQVQQTRGGFAPGGVNVTVTAAASQGQLGGAIAANQVGDAQITVRGASGTVVLDLAAGSTRAEVAAAINGVTDQTGVQADAVTGEIQASAVGSANFAEVRNLSGTLTGVAGTVEGLAHGTDVQAQVGGVQVTAQGNVIQAHTGDLDARITLADGTGAGSYAFQVTGGGYRFQAGQDAAAGGSFSIPSILPSDLGRGASPAGLESVGTGGANSLLNNPEGAGRVFEAALDDLTRARGHLGALQKNTFESLSNSFAVSYENIAAANSQIRDTDFAQTLAELSSARIRSQAGIFMLQQSNLDAGSVLRLLGQ